VTLGDLIVDVVASASGPLAQGSDQGGSIALRQGGSAANTARWIVASAGQAIFIGAVGRDEWARKLEASLTGAGVRVHLVARGAPTARIVAIVEPSGERSFVTDRGAADLLVTSDLRRSWFADTAALHLPGYSLYNDPVRGAALRAVELARAAGAIVSVDLASRQPILDLGPAEAWARVASVTPDVLFANTSESEAILEGRMERELLDLAAIVVVKRGGAGCRAMARPTSARAPIVVDVPTRQLEASDTTGAGDAFAAGFLVRLLAHEPGIRHRRRALSSASRAGHRTAQRLLQGTHRADALS
jgi:sugar/nucleoside kinase (ribokinase family)